MTVDDINRLKKIIERIPAEDGKYICRIIYRDPFDGFYTKLLLFYVFILGGFLLWPFDFLSFEKNDARWIENSNGIEFPGTGQAICDSSNKKFFDRLVNGKGLTLELWLQTEDMNQSGPARIFSYSLNTGLRNFTIGQSHDELVVRLRTTKTSLNGTNPHLIVDDTFDHRGLRHLVIMYDFEEQSVYINGEQRAKSGILKGSFSNWDPSCMLIIGNEATGDRPWKGKIYYAAVFDRPLTEKEIRQNYLSGLRKKTNPGPPVILRNGNAKAIGFETKGPVARYLFDEGKGSVIHDTGSLLNPVNLFVPEYIRHKTKPFLGVSVDYLQDDPTYSDIIINILIFIPLGVLIHGMLRTRYGLTLRISLITLLAGTLFSLGVESIQHFSMSRSSSLIDVVTNMTGTAIGIGIDRVYILFLNHQAKRLRMLLYNQRE